MTFFWLAVLDGHSSGWPTRTSRDTTGAGWPTDAVTVNVEAAVGIVAFGAPYDSIQARIREPVILRPEIIEESKIKPPLLTEICIFGIVFFF
jgi:hypothetical protein